jgi:RNA polymerase subunit RPABC4/transcription elongation factor Spt4
MMMNAKRSEGSGFIACLVGVVMAAAGFYTVPLAGNSTNLAVLGLAIASVGFIVYLHYSRVYSKLVTQLAKIAFATAKPCPKCGKPLPEGQFGFCPFCGSNLSIETAPAEVITNDELTVNQKTDLLSEA